MNGRPIRTSLGSEPYGSALVCTGPRLQYLEKWILRVAFFHFSFQLHKTGNLYKCKSKSLQLLEKELMYKHELQNLAIMLLIYTRDTPVNIQIQRKDSAEDMYSFFDWRSITNTNFS